LATEIEEQKERIRLLEVASSRAETAAETLEEQRLIKIAVEKEEQRQSLNQKRRIGCIKYIVDVLLTKSKNLYLEVKEI
jgi:hypothetical protein